MKSSQTRHCLSRTEGFKLITDYYRSGLGCKEYYTLHHLSEWQFYKWKRLYLLEHPKKETVPETTCSAGSPLFSPLEVSSAPHPLSLPSIEIVYTDGKIIRIAEGLTSLSLIEQLLNR
jgi:hypothetical protein